jgi:hypothetical protein
MLRQTEAATAKKNAVRVQVKTAPAVDKFRTGKQGAGFNGNGEFLKEFPLQGICIALPFLNLAAGKFPFPAQVASGFPPRYECPAILKGNARNGIHL